MPIDWGFSSQGGEPSQSDPWAWSQWAQQRDPGTYGTPGGQRPITADDLASYRKTLQQAGLWTPQMEAYANWQPASQGEDGYAGTGGPQPTVDMSALQGYQVGANRGPGHTRFVTLYRPDGSLAGLEGYQRESTGLKDYAQAAAIVGGGAMGFNAIGNAIAGAGAGALAGTGGMTVAEQIAMMEANGLTAAEIAAATGGNVAGYTAADIAAMSAGTGAAGAVGSASSTIGTGLKVPSTIAAGTSPYALTAGGTSLVPSAATAAGKAAMGIGDWVNIGGTVLNGVLQSNANSDAQDAIANAGRDANALQKYMYDTSRSDNEPWRTAGQAALANLTGLLNSGELSSRFAGKIDNEKGYQFARDEGLRAIDRKAAAGGGFGAGAQKAGIRFAEANANQFYNDAFNRWNTENNGTFNRLSGLAGTGQIANQQVGQAGANYANQAGNNLMGVGNAVGAAALNQGNIYGNMLNQGIGYGNRNWWQTPTDPNAINGQTGLPNYALDPYGRP